LLFPPGKVLSALSSRVTSRKSARLRGRAMLQPLSVPLQNGVRFFRHPLPATPSASLAGAPAQRRTAGRDDGFTIFRCNDTDDLVPACHTGSLECPCAPCVRGSNRLHCRFWLEPFSIFGSLGMTVPEAVHLRWTCHPACPSDRLDAGSRGSHFTATSSSHGWSDVVSAASDRAVTSPASADRLLRTEPQVLLMSIFIFI